MQITVAHDMDALQEALLEVARAGKSLALVPTMGALHAGHMSLVRQAKEHADVVAVSVFVNPKQFGPTEDFAKYPRSLDNDIKLADEAGATILYAPTSEDMYPQGFATGVTAGPIGAVLDGAFRPGHFDGVATVVTKLLLRFLPKAALFGEKDYQQLTILRQLATDLDIPVDIVGVPTLREPDGLAMSSRNVYLTPKEREVAPVLFATLKSVAVRLLTGTAPAEALSEGVADLNASGYKVDYLELRHADTLEPLDSMTDEPARLLVAAWLGKTRLIDNIAVE